MISPKRSLKTAKSDSDKTITQAEQCVDCRAIITETFFESFFAHLVIGKTSIKALDLNSPNDSSMMINKSITDSISATDSGTSNSTKCSSIINSKDSSFNSVTTNISACTSCASTCACYWRVSFRNGNLYEGQLFYSLMQCKGTYYWSDGSIYKGEFKDGYPCGLGKLTLPDLSAYEGEFNVGFFHGKGTINIKSSPILYNGEWKLSKRHGSGWMLYGTNNWYEGDWLNDSKHGYGYRHYTNGDQYKGNWINDRINGKGHMMWHNNDYYAGEWKNCYQHGYGEYTWNLIAHNSFVFPNYNWYKGSWVEGQRSGAGIMNFGHESGAKLAGTWLNNKKHGPGVMVCGNGLIIERDPLFTEDKPSCYVKNKNHTSSSLNKIQSGLNSYRSITKHVMSKQNLSTLDKNSLKNIAMSSSTIKMNQYVKLLERNTGNDCPLKIPIHNVIHEVNLDYFIEDFVHPKTITDMSTMEIEHIINTHTENTNIMSPSCFNYLSSSADLDTYNNIDNTASQQCVLDINELKNLIINYLPQLRAVYKTYASVCASENELFFEPVLVRMFLWQLYRDIGVTEKRGISIVELDEMLMRNPNSCLETLHDPWERIYFWQFIQAIVGVACLLYSTENQLDYTPSSGFMYYMFKDFMENRVLALSGTFQGNCLTHLKDLISVDAVHKLYKEIGEPHTVEEFLKNICLKQQQSVPCYKVINYKNNCEYTVQTGTNVVVLNDELLYLEEEKEVNKQTIFYKDLYTFSTLGKRKILQSICKICPLILLPTGRYNLTYKLSFIEFYETMLLLAFEKVEQDRLKLIETLKTQSSMELKSVGRDASKISTHSGKKKKLKK